MVVERPRPESRPEHNDHIEHVALRARSPLVGREAELDAIRELLASGGVVTVTGLTGIGKSRLIAEVVDGFARADRSVAIVQVGASLSRATAEDLRPATLHTTDALVVADLTRLAQPDARSLAEVVASSGRPTLFEADAPLGVEGERVVALAPLSAAAAGALFEARVRETVPGFDATEADGAAIREIVGHLDGHPLAIEIAAARGGTLPLADLARRLGQHGNLAVDSPTRAAIEWTCSLLDPFERELLGALSVFRRSWRATTVEQLAIDVGLSGDVLVALESLVARSLVARDVEHGAMFVPAALRDHARARLLESGRAGLVRDWHLAWVLAGLEPGAADRAEPCDVEAAFEWALAVGDPDSAGRVVLGMVEHWTRTDSPMVGLAAARRALAIAESDDARASLLLVCSAFELAAHDTDAAASSAEAALELATAAGDRRAEAYARCARARVARATGDLESARLMVESARTTLVELDDVGGIAASMRELGLLSSAEGDIDVSRALLEEGLRSLDRAGSLEPSFGAAFDASLGGGRGRSVLLTEIGQAHALAGDSARAAAFLDEALQVALAHDNTRGRIDTLMLIAQLAAQCGWPRDAATLVGGVHRIAPDQPTPLLEALRLRLGDDELAECLAAGETMPEADAVAMASDLVRRCGSDSGSARRLRKAFVFTDIVGSTELIERIGDDAWAETLRRHDRVLRSCFVRHSGLEVKSTGDGFLVVFDDVDAALECACAVQRDLAAAFADAEVVPGIRVGLHCAEAFMVRSDFAGRGVHLAARIAGAAGAGEVMVSAETAGLLGAEAADRLGPQVEMQFKGIAGPVAVRPVRWA